MTDRLYYHDSYLLDFSASVVESAEAAVYLDRTAFYPTSGGQPFDTGHIAGVRVLDVVDEGERIRHILDAPLPSGITEVHAAVDRSRRFDHMQQHTGQHLLSAVLIERFNLPTVSFRLGQEISTIDIEAASIDAAVLAEAESRANEIVFEDRPVAVSYHDATEDIGLRKATEREGTIRVVTIDSLDRSACGGTHVRRTGEIGPIQIRGTEKIRGIVRIHFLCGWRTVRRTRADFEALTQVARVFSAALDEAPALVESQRARLGDLEKSQQKLLTELAQARGRALYDSTAPNPQGQRFVTRSVTGGFTEELRAEAQAFTARPGAMFLALSDAPAAVMLAVSPDSSVKAGATLKPLFAKYNGRGGGSPQLAQGSLPDNAFARSLAEELRTILGAGE